MNPALMPDETEDSAETTGETYSLPPDAVPEGTKAGDTITFHVEQIGDDGTVTVSCDHGDGEKESVNWREELRKNVPKEGM